MAGRLPHKPPLSASLNADNIVAFQTPSERDPLAHRMLPRDTCHLAYLIFFLHGVGHLLPWNFFITAQQYFKLKFTCPPSNFSDALPCERFLSSSFENWFSVASMVPIFIMSGLNVWLQSKFHYRSRMIVSLVVMLVLFLFTTALVAAPTEKWVGAFFALTLVSVFIMNMASSVFQSSTFGFAGVLPQKYTSAVMSGQAVAGVFAAVASILSQLIASNASGGQSSKATQDSAYGYFGLACFVILLCLLSVFLLSRLGFVRHFLEQTSVRLIQKKQEKAVAASVQTRVRVQPSYRSIMMKVRWYAVSVYLVFAVTISLFPALISQIESAARSDWTGTYFPSIVCFLMFNVSDLTGRYITHWVQTGSHRVVLLVACALRSLFIPAFLLYHQQMKDHFHTNRDFDVVPVFLVLLFGLSNGYLGTVAMITGPQQVRDDEKETASTIMAFFLAGGLCTGGVLSFAWTHLASL